MRFLRSLFLAGILCASIVPAAAQQRGLTLGEVEELLRSGVASERVLLLVQQRCIHFAPDNAAMKVVAAAGGSEALVAALRSTGQCTTLARDVQPARPPAEAPDTAPVKDGVWSFLIGYNQETFRSAGDTDVGRGAALDLSVGADPILFFLRGDFADANPDSRPHYTVGQSELGMRAFGFPARWFVRPYVDLGGGYSEITYTNPQEAGGDRSGWGWTVAGGVLLQLTSRLGIDAAYRRSTISYKVKDDGDAPPVASDPLRGRGERLMVALRWSGVITDSKPRAGRTPR
ncbi:MAG TPA: hypothetical protein VF710_09530 [Longimicrobium sp.]